ncbi:MAG: flagellar basal body rod protein FlgC [Firmicutes bacterium]|nr:flagellar basal body rod protein FlgC [Bacillota bacterium]
MSVFDSFRISASGLTAEKLRMDLIANNLANVNTTQTEEGGPYRRQMAIFQAIEDAKVDRRQSNSKLATGKGVKVVGIYHDPSPPRLVYDPEHPDANADGYVELPNIQPVKEMVDLISASRAYEANITAINAAKSMAQKALEIGKG